MNTITEIAAALNAIAATAPTKVAYTIEIATNKADGRRRGGSLRSVKKIDLDPCTRAEADAFANGVRAGNPNAEVSVHETYVKVISVVGGHEVTERYDTPYCCSVGSERYWTM